MKCFDELRQKVPLGRKNCIHHLAGKWLTVKRKGKYNTKCFIYHESRKLKKVIVWKIYYFLLFFNYLL